MCHTDQGKNSSGSYTKGHGREGGDMRQQAQLHKGQVLPDQSSGWL